MFMLVWLCFILQAFIDWSYGVRIKALEERAESQDQTINNVLGTQQYILRAWDESLRNK